MDKDSIPATVAAAILQTITNCLTKSWTSLRWMVFASGDLIKHYISSEGTQSKQRGEQNCLLLPPFQIVSHFGFSRYIAFAAYVDIYYVIDCKSFHPPTASLYLYILCALQRANPCSSSLAREKSGIENGNIWKSN